MSWRGEPTTVLRVGLSRHEKVARISAETGLPVLYVVGCLHELWGWALSRARGLCVPGVGVGHLKVILPSIPPEFWDAVVHVGWLRETAEGVEFPDAEWLLRYQAGRERRVERQRRWRSQRSDGDGDVDVYKTGTETSTGASRRRLRDAAKDVKKTPARRPRDAAEDLYETPSRRVTVNGKRETVDSACTGDPIGSPSVASLTRSSPQTESSTDSRSLSPPSPLRIRDDVPYTDPQPNGRSNNGKGRRPARRCPEDFVLTRERLAFALGEGLPETVARREFAKLRDHEFKVAHSDWDAVWRNWVRRVADARRDGGFLTAGERAVAAARELVENPAGDALVPDWFCRPAPTEGKSDDAAGSA